MIEMLDSQLRGEDAEVAAPGSRSLPLSGPVMSLPVSYQMKVCRSHSSLHLHITSEITRCAESSEGEIGAEQRMGNLQKNNFQFFSNIASFMDMNSAGSHAGHGCYLLNFHSR